MCGPETNLLDFRRSGDFGSQIFPFLGIISNTFIIISENLFVLPIITCNRCTRTTMLKERISTNS
jgi:hypothetical protein